MKLNPTPRQPDADTAPPRGLPEPEPDAGPRAEPRGPEGAEEAPPSAATSPRARSAGSQSYAGAALLVRSRVVVSVVLLVLSDTHRCHWRVSYLSVA